MALALSRLYPLLWRIIPDDMSSLSPATLANRGGAMLNFALTEFYEVRQKNPEQKLHLSAYFHRRFIASCSNGLKELPSVGLRNEGGGAYEAHSLVGHGGVGHGGGDVGHGDAGFRWGPGG